MEKETRVIAHTEDTELQILRKSESVASVLTSAEVLDCQTAGPSKMNICERKIAKRKYHDSYLDIGFIETNDNKPQCVICGKVLPNSAMFPAKMRRHLEGVHPECKDKPNDFFQRKSGELKKNTKKYNAQTLNEKSLKASYLVSYRIAKAGKSHIIAETLIKPCVKDIVETMMDEKDVKLVTTVPLSNNTISRRIVEMADDVKNTLISRIKDSSFSLQLDESTDVAGLAVLIVFVRYQFGNSFQEDLLFCKPLPTNTTGAEIFKLLDEFFVAHDIPWKNCIDVCTDGAKAMTGKTSGVVPRIKEKNSNCNNSHCVLHRHALAVKKMSPSLKEVLDECVKIINYIKSRPLNSRLFKILCDDMGSLHTTLLLHTEVRWLSRGKTLTRLFELRAEVRSFLMESDFALKGRFSEEQWLSKLAYLADIFSKANDLSTSLQGKSISVFDVNDRVKAFKRKLVFWAESLNKQNLDSFPLLKELKEEFDFELPNDLMNEFHIHLITLRNNYQEYFPEEFHDKIIYNSWVANPYNAISEKPASLTSEEYECLIDLTSDSGIRHIFLTKSSISEFWCKLRDEFHLLSDKAKTILLPFATTYLCEAGFSAYLMTKTKYRSRLNADPDIRLQLSEIEPNITALSKLKQAHPSH